MTAAPSTTSTDYSRPFRPWPVKLFNRLPRLRSDEAIFDAEKLLAHAVRVTGESTPSSAPLLEPLAQLCEAIRKEAKLSAFGRIIQSTRLKTLLINRLRLDAFMRKHPEILAQETPDIIVIAGLARTGTTLLHRTLAAAPDARSLPSWEALSPAPLPSEQPGLPGKRIKAGERAADYMSWLAPDFSAIHPVSATQPEEDILLLDMTFMSQTAEALMHVPSYSAWLERQDHTPAYAYLRDVLKTLIWLTPRKYWVLKTPNHSEHLEALINVFPDATIIQTHRDPMKTMASCCSLMAHSQGLSSDHVDPHLIGKHWLRKANRMATKASDARQKHAHTNVIDVYYQDLVDNPYTVIKSIYETHGLAMTQAAETAIHDALNEERPAVSKRHAYALKDFGLTPEDIETSFGPYCSQYDIPRERLAP